MISNYLVFFCGIFYLILCIFSIVTGLIYISGKRKLNTLELSDNFIKRLDSKEKIDKFTKKMGFVTCVVGIFQGISSIAFIKEYNTFFYYFSFCFTIFSICSVIFKLKGKINLFPIIKLIFYILILIIMLLPSVRRMYFINSYEIRGIENYNKNYYIKNYKSDLDSNLSVFPDDKSMYLNVSFSSYLKTHLFDNGNSFSEFDD